jgi:hypothetical protein
MNFRELREQAIEGPLGRETVVKLIDECLRLEVELKDFASSRASLAIKHKKAQDRIAAIEEEWRSAQRFGRNMHNEVERLTKLLPHLVDVVWGEAHEDESVPSTAWARRLIVQARETYDPDDPLPPPCVACGGTGRNRPPGLKMPGWGEVCAKCKGSGIADEDDR